MEFREDRQGVGVALVEFDEPQIVRRDIGENTPTRKSLALTGQRHVGRAIELVFDEVRQYSAEGERIVGSETRLAEEYCYRVRWVRCLHRLRELRKLSFFDGLPGRAI
ncbi:hypothetical protein [Paraburkholderia caledonica]|uniref:Uncharacterized protein n=1 Tax=Paraburkholderia caledonica TaxID=134536 RepID=A0ABU1KSQ1_9BURK|nr:hypothetical protein [Paraburkholderia caledonica]